MRLKGENNNEDKLLDKAIGGDRISLNYLVNTYKDLAYTIAVRIVVNHEDAEEVVQDSFMKAFKSLHHFKKASKFSTWLYRIVYNTAVSKVKTKKLTITDIALHPEVERYTAADDQHGDMLESEERKKYIDLALDKLQADDRTIITLYYIAGKNIAEVCEILNMKKSAVKMRLLRSRKQIITELESLLNNEVKSLL